MRFLFLLAALSLAPAQNASVIVEGIVTDSERGAPLSNAMVQLQGGPSYVTVFTGPDGRFRLTAAPGEYQLWVERIGFYGPMINPARSSSVARRLILVAGQQPPDQAVSLTPSGVITGRVLNPAGLPVYNAAISAVRIRRFDEPFIDRAQTVNTNELGEYRLYWIGPGDYFVMVDQESRSAAPSPTLVSGAASSNVLVRTYYPGTTRLDAASPVTVPAGAEVRGIDFTIQTSTTFTISGRVVSPVPGITARPEFVLIHPDFGTQEIRIPPFSNTAALTQRDTSLFELRGIPPGRYELHAHIRDAMPGVHFSGKTSIEIRTQDLKDVVIPLRQPVEVQGRVVTTGDIRPPFNASVSLSYIGQRQGMLTSGTYAIAEPGGEFVLKGLPEGDYRINAQAFRPGLDTFVADIKQGGRSVMKDGIVKVSGNNSEELEIVVSPDPGRVSGTVIHPDGKKDGHTNVVLVPEPSLRSNPIRFRSFNTRGSNTFDMRAIAPGRYKIFAWENVPGENWMEPQFLATYENQGLDLEVTAGKATVINIPVIGLK